MLGASFFFSRGDGPLRDPQLASTKLAFQLAESDDVLKRTIMEAVKLDSTLRHKRILSQLDGLILKPSVSIQATERHSSYLMHTMIVRKAMIWKF
jgi:hypothetical protein